MGWVTVLVPCHLEQQGAQEVGVVQTLLAGLREVLARCEAGARPVVDASQVAAWAAAHTSAAQGSALAVPGPVVSAGVAGSLDEANVLSKKLFASLSGWAGGSGFAGQPAVVAWVSAGNLMQAPANSGPSVDFGISVPHAGVRIHNLGALNRDVEKVWILEKGKTPVMGKRMVPFLRRYPNRNAAKLLELGFTEGFKFNSRLQVVPPVADNLKSAREHACIVTEKLFKEVLLGRMAGPFELPPVPDLVISSLGVVPKKESNKFRLIHHLSHPRGGSVNDSIDPGLCTVSYMSFDTVVAWVQRLHVGG